jgi:hypothetical protein
MADTWTITFTDANGRVGTNTCDNETVFISGVRDQLNDLRTTNVSAVLPDGTRLDEKALGVRYGLSGAPVGRASMGNAAWLEIERLLGEIRQALDQMTLEEDALILEATVEVTEHIERELKALVAEAQTGTLSRRDVVERLYALRLEIDRRTALH